MKKKMYKRKIVNSITTLAGAVLLAAAPLTAEAMPLLPIPGSLNLSSFWPDIQSDNVSFNGIAFTGTATNFSDGISSSPISGGLFSLDTTNDTISIGGNFVYNSNSYGTAGSAGSLLTGTLTMWDNNPGLSLHEFMLNINGGDAAALFGTTGVTIIDLFSNKADTSPVPEPATMSLMLAGGSALAAFRSRRKTTPEDCQA